MGYPMDSNFNFECLLLVGIVIALVTTVNYFNYFNREAKKAPWKKFAEQHNLKFMPASWFGGGAFVSGRYRGYKFMLASARMEQKVFTIIKLSLNPIEKLSPPQKHQINEGEAAIRKIIRWADSISPDNPDKTLKFINRQFFLEQARLETGAGILEEIFNEFANIADSYNQVVRVGGKAIPLLLEKRMLGGYLKEVSNQLLHDIAKETKLRLSHESNQLYCKKCLVACSLIAIPLPQQLDVHYYGCRNCGQSREFIKSDQVVAILDNQSQTEYLQQKNILRVNWIVRRELFDFDQIEILHVTDEEVERFAVQVGNDTDPERKPRYKSMRCKISSTCELSENTMRILARMFGEVAVITPEVENGAPTLPSHSARR
jgi:RNase P subunit RPR2